MPPDNASTVATGTSQIIGMAIIETTAVNSILAVRNPAGNTTALTITPSAGGSCISTPYYHADKLNI